MDNKWLFKQEEMRQHQYQAAADRMGEQNDTEVAYSTLNSRYQNAYENYRNDDLKKQLDKMSADPAVSEKMQDKAEEEWKKTSLKEAEQRREKKKQIENAWHRNTSAQKKELEKRKGKGSPKEAAYYANYSLNELEIFIKNSDRGGNSQEYNDVATDLEAYNRMMAREGTDINEEILLLKRLQESCNTYLETRKRTFWRSGTGKIRRAIIESISLKVNEMYDRQTTKVMEDNQNAKSAYENEKSEDNINQALKMNYNLISQVLSGNIQLSDDEMKQLDRDAELVMRDMRKCKVDESQGDNLATRFFNALGWSGNKARIVSKKDLAPEGAEMKKSPVKQKMFHSMNSFTKTIPADPETGAPEKTVEIKGIDMAHQLSGTREKDNRFYYGLGRFGKGVYTSAANDRGTSSESLAYNNSWSYGRKKGAAMMIMTLNENARIATQSDVLKLLDKMQKIFPKLSNAISDLEVRSKGGYIDYLTIIAAYFGINTIKGISGIKSSENTDGLDDVDYYTTTDRKAFSICDIVEVRSQDKEGSEPTTALDFEEYSLTEHKFRSNYDDED